MPWACPLAAARCYTVSIDTQSTFSTLLTRYGWIVLKNVIGWLLILASGPIGLLIPGPGGLPLFLVGFALVTFPGKRALTARVLRGRPFNPNSAGLILGQIIASLFLPAAVIGISPLRFSQLLQRHGPLTVWMLYAVAILASAILLRLVAAAGNYGLRFVPRIRRKVRPWLRRHGFHLLPPRRKQRLARIEMTSSSDQSNAQSDQADLQPDLRDDVPAEPEILIVDDRYQQAATSFWKRYKAWLRPIASVLLMGAIFGWMIHRISGHWADVRDRAGLISKTNFIIASILFAIFLFAFRSLVWRRILKRFGYRIPVAPAARIWSSSEMARYIPGVIMQVAGRVYLVKPYGVPGSVCAASQVLELVTFLMANLLLGFGCMVVFGFRHLEGTEKFWICLLAALLPLLALVLHPRIFYGMMNRIMARLKKPPLTNRLGGYELSRLLIWNILGLLLQSVAVFLIVADPLKLHWDKWYVVTGAYSLAWCAGFLAVLNPAGLGVREAVFVGILLFALPQQVREEFSNTSVLKSFLIFLGALLRLWTIAGELILTGIAHVLDHKGAMGIAPQSVRSSAIKQSRLSDPAGQS